MSQGDIPQKSDCCLIIRRFQHLALLELQILSKIFDKLERTLHSEAQSALKSLITIIGHGDKFALF